MPNAWRSLTSNLRSLGNSFVEVVLHASLWALNFRLWFSFFHNARNGWFGVGDVFVGFALLLGLWLAYRRHGLAYAGALLGAMLAAYLQLFR
ncbi:hypothetical protein E0687_02200 [Thermus tengchongensis]|uniref:Uncharacterized protein n=1 Tax=Thermus tengchongensis TaxID=1214928 RepID=A0A4Y9FFB7_9DEIN|nr:hypothetical protein E0687_02200 [Thermus tengchongensis]